MIKKSIYELILTRRSIRKFKQRPISVGFLNRLVNAARLAPSGANLQPLEFIVIRDKKMLERVFATLAWAGYIAPCGTPRQGERPAAYIVTVVNTAIRKENYQWDAAAAIENMILTSWAAGVGSCWIGSISRLALGRILNIPREFIIDSVLALGFPAERPELERLDAGCKYWKDAKGRLHVPKRDFSRVVHYEKF